MTEREKWEAGLWYDANYTPELCAEREKAEELYTEFNQTRPSEKAKRAELLRQLLPHMEEHVVILPHLYVDYGYHCFIGAGTYINHGAYLMDCAKITLGRHCFIGPNCGMYTAIHPMLPEERNSGLETTAPITLGDNVWLGGDVTILPGVTIGSNTVIGAGSVVTRIFPPAWWPWATPVRCCGLSPKKTASGIRNNCNNKKRTAEFSTVPLFVVENQVLFFFWLIVQLFPVLLHQICTELEQCKAEQTCRNTSKRSAHPIAIGQAPQHRNRHGRQQRINRIGSHTGRKMAVPQAIPDALCNGVNTSGHKNDPFSDRFICIARQPLNHHCGQQTAPHQAEATLPNFAQSLLLHLIQNIFLAVQ